MEVYLELDLWCSVSNSTSLRDEPRSWFSLPKILSYSNFGLNVVSENRNKQIGLFEIGIWL